MKYLLKSVLFGGWVFIPVFIFFAFTFCPFIEPRVELVNFYTLIRYLIICDRKIDGEGIVIFLSLIHISFEFVSVKASEGGDAEVFKKEITVRGGGVMELPLYTELPVGRYVVTLKVSNDGYSELLSDVYTFVVK